MCFFVIQYCKANISETWNLESKIIQLNSSSDISLSGFIVIELMTISSFEKPTTSYPKNVSMRWLQIVNNMFVCRM